MCGGVAVRLVTHFVVAWLRAALGGVAPPAHRCARPGMPPGSHCGLSARSRAAHDCLDAWKCGGMSTPGEDGRPRSGAGIDPDRPAIHREQPPAVPALAAGVIRCRPSGERPPLPKNLRGAARFWLVMILLLVVAPFLGLGAAGGSGSYVGEINDAARKLLSLPIPRALR